MGFAYSFRDGDWPRLRQIIQKLSSLNLGPDSTPTFAGLTLNGDLSVTGETSTATLTITSLTASRLVDSNASKGVESVTALTDYIIQGSGNQVVVTGANGAVTLSTPQDIHTGATPTFDDLTITTPVNIYALSHDSFADFVSTEHLDHALNIDANLQVWLRGDDETGGEPEDLGQAGNAWTYEGHAAQTDEGVIGKGITFDGTGDYLNMTSPSGMPTGSSPRTIAYWIRTSAVRSEFTLSYGTASAGAIWDMWVLGATTGATFIYVSGGNASSTTALNDGKWHHFAVTSDGGDIKDVQFYIDGEPDATASSVTEVLQTTQAAAMIGKSIRAIATSDLTGQMDDIRIYDRELTAAEVKQLYELGTLDAMTSFSTAYFTEYVASKAGYFHNLHVECMLNIEDATVTADTINADTINTSDVWVGEDGRIGVARAAPVPVITFDGTGHEFEFTDGDVIIAGYGLTVDTDLLVANAVAGTVAIGGNTTVTGNLVLSKDGECTFQSTSYVNAATESSQFIFRTARGTTAVPAVSQDDDRICSIDARGYSANAAAFKTAAGIFFEIDGEPDTGADTTDMPGRITFRTTPDGSSTTVERVRIDNAGNVGINTTSPDTRLQVVGDCKFGDDNTNYTSLSTTGVQTMVGTARVWLSQDLKPSSIKHPSANGPGSTEYENIYYDAYASGAMEQVFYIWHVPNNYAAGTASVRGHFGLMVASPPVNPDPTEIVAMGFEYMKFSDGDVLTWAADGGNAIDISIVMDETAYTWHVSGTGVCDTTGWVPGDLIVFRFFRDIAGEYSANDDYDGGDALVGVYHLEYLADKLGEAS